MVCKFTRLEASNSVTCRTFHFNDNIKLIKKSKYNAFINMSIPGPNYQHKLPFRALALCQSSDKGFIVCNFTLISPFNTHMFRCFSPMMWHLSYFDQHWANNWLHNIFLWCCLLPSARWFWQLLNMQSTRYDKPDPGKHFLVFTYHTLNDSELVTYLNLVFDSSFSKSCHQLCSILKMYVIWKEKIQLCIIFTFIRVTN